MTYPGFEDALRRVVTGNDTEGRSTMIVDGGPAEIAAIAGAGGLLEIWTDSNSQQLDPKDHADRGQGAVLLAPPEGGVKIRWFVIEPVPGGVPKEQMDERIKEVFRGFGAEQYVKDQSRHPAMHVTPTLDVICLLSGEASLVLEKSETRLKPGQIVIQRGTNHAWVAHGGPALFLSVLIDRPIAH